MNSFGEELLLGAQQNSDLFPKNQFCLFTHHLIV